jgi:hypothetical protein
MGVVMSELMASGQAGRVRLGQVLVGYELVVAQQMLEQLLAALGRLLHDRSPAAAGLFLKADRPAM